MRVLTKSLIFSICFLLIASCSDKNDKPKSALSPMENYEAQFLDLKKSLALLRKEVADQDVDFSEGEKSEAEKNQKKMANSLYESKKKILSGRALQLQRRLAQHKRAVVQADDEADTSAIDILSDQVKGYQDELKPAFRH